MNENLDRLRHRLRHGWHPRKDAHWFWWVLAALIVLLSIAKLEIPKVWRRRPKHLRLTK
jgi:hypothetical protein